MPYLYSGAYASPYYGSYYGAYASPYYSTAAYYPTARYATPYAYSYASPYSYSYAAYPSYYGSVARYGYYW